MVTCFLKYTIDPYKVAEFELYAKAWIGFVNKMGGTHHGYLLPYEGANNIAYASFSFNTMAEYEVYRINIKDCEPCQKILDFATKEKFILNYERSFMRPIFEEFDNK